MRNHTGASLHDEGATRSGVHRADTRRVAGIIRGAHLGGPEGNEILTSATAVLLLALLAAEGVTVVDMSGLLTAHMFIGMVLIPPVALKLSSTGYRFVRYYTGSRPYREKGPPLLPLRLLAPVLVAATVSVLASGVWLLALGHRSDLVLQVHKVSVIVWIGLFALHVLAYLPRVAGSLRADWGAARRAAVHGAGLRAMLVACSLGGGLALALALLSAMSAWRGGHHLHHVG
jgi:hypothetical protein